jgi:hypothetical protein
MEQFDYNKYRKNNPLLKEGVGDKLSAGTSMLLGNLEHQLRQMRNSRNTPDAKQVIDMVLAVFDEIKNS